VRVAKCLVVNWMWRNPEDDCLTKLDFRWSPRHPALRKQHGHMRGPCPSQRPSNLKYNIKARAIDIRRSTAARLYSTSVTASFLFFCIGLVTVIHIAQHYKFSKSLSSFYLLMTSTSIPYNVQEHWRKVIPLDNGRSTARVLGPLQSSGP
jgi:hypothetical protein